MQAIGSRSDHGGKTAKALKLKVLRSILARADQVIGEALNVRVGSEAAMPVIGGQLSTRKQTPKHPSEGEVFWTEQSWSARMRYGPKADSGAAAETVLIRLPYAPSAVDLTRGRPFHVDVRGVSTAFFVRPKTVRTTT